jgi:hypothetical protein
MQQSHLEGSLIWSLFPGKGKKCKIARKCVTYVKVHLKYLMN